MRYDNTYCKALKAVQSTIAYRCSHHKMISHYLLCFFYFFLAFVYFTALREQDKAYINSSRWSMLVGLGTCLHPHVSCRSTTVLQTPTIPSTDFYLFYDANDRNLALNSGILHTSTVEMKMDNCHQPGTTNPRTLAS